MAAGFVAGVLDLAYVFVFHGLRGVSATSILQSIASGLLGVSAFKGGFRTALLGVALHFIIALGAALTYWAASRRLTFLRSNAIVCGLLYGFAIYCFMEWVVLPLSAAPQFKTTSLTIASNLAAHACLIGLPIALFARRVSD